MITTTSATAKFILCGEHFVCGKTPGIVVPAPCFSTRAVLYDTPPYPRATETANSGNAGYQTPVAVRCTFDAEQNFDDFKPSFEALLSELVAYGVKIAGFDLKGLSLQMRVETTIPPGQGAGSSSALCQSIIHAIFKHFLIQGEIHPNYLMFFGKQLETYLHGEVSGIDNAAVAFQTPMRFCKGEPIRPILMAEPAYFVVGSTGPRKSSPYEIMLKAQNEQPRLYGTIRDEIAKYSEQMFNDFEKGDLPHVGELMNDTQRGLRSLGLSTFECEKAIEVALEENALGAKLTGAGCGGFVIALAHIQDIERIQLAWINLGLSNVRTFHFDGRQG